MIKRFAILAIILTVASGCDKAKAFVRSGRQPGPPQVAAGAGLDLASKPQILFQVFGDRADPRMVPLGVLRGGKLLPIVLTQAGWKQFDGMYLRRGMTYPLYRDGRQSGTVAVRHGMWEKGSRPLYALPGCSTLTPLAAVTVSDATAKGDLTLEFLAASSPLTVDASASSPGVPLPPPNVAREARAMAAAVATMSHLEPAALDSLDLRAVELATGAGHGPTLIASLIDPTMENNANRAAKTVHLLMIADRDASGAYRPTYSHVTNGPLSGTTFRRYFDHADLTGDGVDEIILEGWQCGGDTFLLALGYENRRWTEIFRTRPNWCLDERQDR